MKKPLALFDIDKTMFRGLSYTPLLEAQIEEGLLKASTGERARGALGAYATGFLSYETVVRVLLDIYAEGLAGNSVEAVQASTDAFFDQTDGFFGYVAPTIDLFRPSHEVTLVTGGTQFTAAAVARVFGVDNFISSQLEVDGGILPGRMRSYLATRRDKRDAIGHLVEDHPFEGSFGFGDSEGDIEMLHAVENPVCIRPTPGLSEVARAHGWTVVESAEELASSTGLMAVRLALRAA